MTEDEAVHTFFRAGPAGIPTQTAFSQSRHASPEAAAGGAIGLCAAGDKRRKRVPYEIKRWSMADALDDQLTSFKCQNILFCVKSSTNRPMSIAFLPSVG
jgi:hypothetical protein